MGVVSNKVNITDLQKGGGGGGDPTIPGRVSALETVVGDSTSGLVKDVDDLETVVGDSTSGLVKDVDELKGATATIYSTTETLIGEWIDGKPLYQKTFSLLNYSDNDTSSHNITIVDLSSLPIDYCMLVACDIKVTRKDDASSWWWVNGSSRYNYSTTNEYFNLTTRSLSNKMTISSSGMWWSYNCKADFYVTIRYTKTTD